VSSYKQPVRKHTPRGEVCVRAVKTKSHSTEWLFVLTIERVKGDYLPLPDADLRAAEGEPAAAFLAGEALVAEADFLAAEVLLPAALALVAFLAVALPVDAFFALVPV
jgi:hypothetical protein